MATFDRSYTRVLSGVRPEFVANFFEEIRSLQLNENQPTVGRSQIVEMAKYSIHDLKNMVVNYDSLVIKSTGTEFHQTFTATNCGPAGTGKKVEVSGYELWQMGKNSLILKTEGHFPTEKYNRQLEFGVEI